MIGRSAVNEELAGGVEPEPRTLETIPFGRNVLASSSRYAVVCFAKKWAVGAAVV